MVHMYKHCGVLVIRNIQYNNAQSKMFMYIFHITIIQWLHIFYQQMVQLLSGFHSLHTCISMGM